MSRVASFPFVFVLACLSAAQTVDIRGPIISQNMSQSSSFGIIWDTPREVWAPKCPAPPKLDGVLDDACWKNAALLTGFVVTPSNHVRPYTNEVRLCYDDANLYLGVRCGEPHPERIAAAVDEDGVVAIWQDDCVEVHIQVDSEKVFVLYEGKTPYKGRPTWAQLITNTLSKRFSQLMCERRPGNTRNAPTDWNDAWRAQARLGKDAWFTEIAIPWEKLQIKPEPGKSFRMNVSRNKPNAPESWNTAAYHHPERFGVVHFGRGPGAGVEVRDGQVDCAGDDWTATLSAVSASGQPQPARLVAELKKADRVLLKTESKIIQVGAQPAQFLVTLPVADTGKYSVDLSLLAGDGKPIARGHVEGEKSPLAERFFLFRRDLLQGEKVINGYYRLATLPKTRELSATFELADGAKILAKAGPQRLTAAEGAFAFAVPPLAVGSPTFRFAIADDRNAVVMTEERGLSVRSLPPSQRERIPFHVAAPGGVSAKAWPITVGVPFGQGMLPVDDLDTRSRVLDAAGKELPCQSRVTATWTDARRHVRWALFDFQADLDAKGADFSVEFGAQVTRQSVNTPPLVAAAATGLQINTGPLTAALSSSEPVFFAGWKVDGKPATQRAKDGELYLKLGDPTLNTRILPRQYEYDTDRSVKTFLAELSKKDYKLELESAGPLRSVIKATGWYAAPDGSRLFQYILRLYVYRGKSWVSAFHTFIATEPEQYVDSIGLRLQRPAGAGPVVVGHDTAAGQERLVPSPYASMTMLLQPSPDAYRVLEFPRKTGGAETQFGTERSFGRRAPGWMDAPCGPSRLLIAVKDFWQESPKHVKSYADGLLDIGLVSGHAPDHLDLRSQPFSKEEQAGGNSEGVAKTTRFVLDFHAPDAEPDATAQRAAAALADPVIWVDPNWMQRADPIWAPVARCAPDAEDWRHRAYASLVAMHGPAQPNPPSIVNGLPRYGVLNYGDRMHGNVWRGWFNNEDYAVPFAEWIAYMATGDTRLLKAVSAFTRHLIDVDSLNYTSQNQGGLGMQSRHRRLHWGQPGIITHTYIDQSLLYYYLFGYERGADNAELFRRGHTVWSWWPAETWWHATGNPYGAVARDYGVDLRCCMDAYLHSWDPVMLVRAHELWARYKRGFLPDGEHVIGYFNVPRGLELYTRYTRDPGAEAAVLKSGVLCPRLSADLGDARKMERAMATLDATLSASGQVMDTPWWAQCEQDAKEMDELNSVLDLGWAERSSRLGKPLRSGFEPLVWWQNVDVLVLEEADQEQDIELRLVAMGEAPGAKITVLDPKGATVKTIAIEPDQLPREMEAYRRLRFTIPRDGLPGVYTLRFEKAPRFWFLKGAERRVFRVGAEFTLGYENSQKFWFFVPKGLQSFRISGRPQNRDARFGFVILDPENRVAGSTAWFYRVGETVPTRSVEVKPPPGTDGKWWSLAYGCVKGITFLWPSELPPCVTDAPEKAFLPPAQ